MNKDKAPVSVNFSHDELVLVNNALNELCNGLDWDDDQLQTRLGYTRDQARKLLAKVAALLKK